MAAAPKETLLTNKICDDLSNNMGGSTRHHLSIRDGKEAIRFTESRIKDLTSLKPNSKLVKNLGRRITPTTLELLLQEKISTVKGWLQRITPEFQIPLRDFALRCASQFLLKNKSRFIQMLNSYYKKDPLRKGRTVLLAPYEGILEAIFCYQYGSLAMFTSIEDVKALCPLAEIHAGLEQVPQLTELGCDFSAVVLIKINDKKLLFKNETYGYSAVFLSLSNTMTHKTTPEFIPPPLTLTCFYRCDTNQTVQKCSKCKSVWYCSKECQTRHWPLHKQDCLAICQSITQKDSATPEIKTNSTAGSSPSGINTLEMSQTANIPTVLSSSTPLQSELPLSFLSTPTPESITKVDPSPDDLNSSLSVSASETTTPQPLDEID
jgi:MYND finger